MCVCSDGKCDYVVVMVVVRLCLWNVGVVVILSLVLMLDSCVVNVIDVILLLIIVVYYGVYRLVVF